VLLVAMTVFFAPRAARAQVCAGDCNNSMSVTSDELLTLADIVLGDDVSSACADGIPTGQTVNVALILQAVNKAKNGCVAGPPVCGDGVVEAPEECDNGSICIGGTNAGKTCVAASDCGTDQGVCVGGPKAYWVCDNDANCPSGACKHCIPQEGNGCAANCTMESELNINLATGVSADGKTLPPGVSGIVVYGELQVPIPFPAGSTRQLTVGKVKDGTIPAVLKAETNQSGPISVLGGAACICLRPVEYMTCGGSLWEEDGTPSTDCTTGYTAGPSLCPSAKPCNIVYGTDNIGAGTIGCTDSGLPAVNVTSTQDSGGGGTPGPVLTSLDTMGGAGSAVVYLTTDLGFIVGVSCKSQPSFCTSNQPKAGVTVLPQVLTTGTASGTVFNADGASPNTLGPYTVTGAVVSCDDVANGSASNASLAGAFPSLNAPTIQDIVVTTNLWAK